MARLYALFGEAVLSAARAMFWEKVLASSGRKTVACRAREVGTAVRR